jgi:hypothetical protein
MDYIMNFKGAWARTRPQITYWFVDIPTDVKGVFKHEDNVANKMSDN